MLGGEPRLAPRDFSEGSRHEHCIHLANMNFVELTIAILAAVLTGAVLPVLFQLRASLRVFTEQAKSANESFKATSAQVQRTTERFEQTAIGLERTNREALAILEEAHEMLAALNRLRSSVSVASAVGAALAPAAVAAYRSFSERREAATSESHNHSNGSNGSSNVLGEKTGE